MAEHFNRVLSESITTMLSESHLPLQFWRKSLTAFVYAHNRYSTFALPSITPFEVWKGHKPDPAYLKLWKYTACVHMQKHKRTSSLGSHMEKYVFFGYSTNYTAILNLDGRCLIVRYGCHVMHQCKKELRAAPSDLEDLLAVSHLVSIYFLLPIFQLLFALESVSQA